MLSIEHVHFSTEMANALKMLAETMTQLLKCLTIDIIWIWSRLQLPFHSIIPPCVWFAS